MDTGGKCSDTEYNATPWEWRTLGVEDPGSGGPKPKSWTDAKNSSKVLLD